MNKCERLKWEIYMKITSFRCFIITELVWVTEILALIRKKWAFPGDRSRRTSRLSPQVNEASPRKDCVLDNVLIKVSPAESLTNLRQAEVGTGGGGGQNGTEDGVGQQPPIDGIDNEALDYDQLDEYINEQQQQQQGGFRNDFAGTLDDQV